MPLAPPNVRQAKATLAEHRKAQRKARPPKVTPTAAGQRKPRIHDKKYLAWIRRLPCAGKRQGPCYGPIEAAHLRYSDADRRRINPGLQRKPSDRLTTPLCRTHHALQHGGAERVFWEIVGIDPGELCAALGVAYDTDLDGAAVIRRFVKRRAL